MASLTKLVKGKAEEITLIDIIKNPFDIESQFNPKASAPLGDLALYKYSGETELTGKMEVIPNCTEAQVLEYLGKRFESEGLYFYE